MPFQSDNARTHFAQAFKDSQVVEAYRYRPTYPPEIFTILASLLTDEPRSVLDIGTGSGDIARHIVTHATRVDAIDFSHNMITHGQTLFNGNNPQLHWIFGKVEEVPLKPPYALITAGSSIHWFDWPIIFPLFRQILTPHGYIALLSRKTLPMPWDNELKQIRTQYSMRQANGAAHALAELEASGFFLPQGKQETAPVPFNQSIDNFITGLHSRSSFSRELMGTANANEFDRQVRALLLRFHPNAILPMQVIGSVTWGKPGKGTKL